VNDNSSDHGDDLVEIDGFDALKDESGTIHQIDTDRRNTPSRNTNVPNSSSTSLAIELALFRNTNDW
jgi:hypothetical protein